jgi:hypothetical protein
MLHMMPPDAHKAPFRESRLVVPIRLTTDPWVNDGSADLYEPSMFSVPEQPEDYHEVPTLRR